LGIPHAVSVNSGTSALYAALVGVGIRPGDEVLVPTLSVSCVGQAVVLAGASPVFVDADPWTWNLSVADAARKITKRTKAVIAVHLFGVPCDMDAVLRLAQAQRLAVIDDAAQALLARWKGKYAGTWGDVGVFSFEQVKALNTGEGGMVVTASRAMEERVRAFAHCRPSRRQPVAGNFRMTAFQAAAGLSQLPRLEEIVATKVRRLLTIRDRLSRIPGVTPQWVPGCAEPSYFRLGYLVSGRRTKVPDPLRKGRRWFPPLHRDPTFRAWVKRAECPTADRIARDLYVM